MFMYKNIVVSDEVIEARFACDLKTCRGICCTNGDAGAPLLKEEADYFLDHKDKLMKFPLEYIQRFERYGIVEKVYVKRLNGNVFCTATCENGDCVFSFVDKNIYYCYLQNSSKTFKKPLSCYLFPIREKIANGVTYLNLYVYDECESCYGKGKPLLVPFLKDVLTGRYGEDFYEELMKEVNARNVK
ncbi:MAG TPA: DUF3109 family protein [Candidatus Wallbacteria bacterium]|nr:MAG: hypothetical protein BWY32_00422 [bacterium ADurb.Bin243]HOD42889.1 DUF3109 family protein [Candidatus Wallbacteria bacterium]HPG57327.1 DUF3109 family protein [Candidatus Wallbacteria bacterium]